MLKMMSTALSTTFLMMGCMTEVDGQEEHEGNEASEEAVSVGTTEQAFTGIGAYSWGDTKTSAADIGTSVGRTCFLSGIGGHMRPGGAYLYSGGTYPARAGVRKKPNGNYEIYVQPDDGKHLIAYVRCIATDAGRIEVGWTSGSQASQGDKIIAVANGARQCFLQDVANYAVPMKDSNGDIYSYGWAFDDAAHPDEVRVINDGSYWKMWVKPGAHTYPVNVHATAVCVDATQLYGTWTWKAPDPGTATIDLVNASTATCGLTGINGRFDAAYGNWSDAIQISNVSTQYKMSMTNGKRAYAGCAR